VSNKGDSQGTLKIPSIEKRENGMMGTLSDDWRASRPPKIGLKTLGIFL